MSFTSPPGASAVLAAAFLLMGCAAQSPAPAPASAEPVASVPEPPLPTCEAEPGQFALGQAASPQLEAAARHRTQASSSRVLEPGQAVTMEFNASRLNLEVDARGRVTAVRCG